MQNKFGLKDFVLLVLVVGVALLVVLGMVQRDREWQRLRSIENKLTQFETQFSRLEQRLENGVAFAPGAGGFGGGTPGGVAARDESWARPGIPIEWQPLPSFAHNPREMPGYQEGGVFTELFEAQPSKLTAILAEDTYGRRVADMVCQALALYDPVTLKLRGELAGAWQYDPEGMWLRVQINPRARFSDGRPVTAEDVVYTFHDYIMNPELETESLRSLLVTKIERVEAISERAVEFTFSEPGAYNLRMALGFYILPKHFYSQFTPAQINQSTGLLMGSGPFRLGELDPQNQWAPGRDVILVRNEQFWANRSALAGMRYRSISDELPRLTAYTNGEADMVMPTSPQFVELTSRSGWDDRHHSLNWLNMRSGYSFIAWQCGPRNGRLTPFHDKRVRQAMTHLLDRERMIRDIYAGIGTVAVGPNNPPSPAAAPDIQPLEFNIARARQLLAEAGWMDRNGDGVLENERGDRFIFEFTRTSGGQIAERVGKFIEDSCAAIGIICRQRVVDWSQFDQILKTRDFDAITLGWSASAPESDPTQIWHTDSIQNQGHNFIQWNGGQDPIIEAIRAEVDDEKRMRLHHDLARLIHEEQPYTFVRSVPWLRFISKRWDNVHTYFTGLEQREFFLRSDMTSGL